MSLELTDWLFYAQIDPFFVIIGIKLGQMVRFVDASNCYYSNTLFCHMVIY